MNSVDASIHKTIDKPTNVRKTEELPLSQLIPFLKEQMGGLNDPIDCKQFPSGFSNLTYLIQSGDRELILRKPPLGKKAKTAHDMHREYRILKALKPVFPYVPEPLLYVDSPDLIGSSFYIMERIKGIILRKNLPAGLYFSKNDAKKLCENWITVLCKLHSVDYQKAGLDGFGKPEGYVKRQIEGWSARYRDAKTKDAPDFEGVMQWLQDRQPQDSLQAAVIHNDYKFDNVVLNPDNPVEIIGVLDWEMATIGDPLMDLGASLAYWVNKDDPDTLQMIRALPTTLEGMMSRKEVMACYAQTIGRPIEGFDFYLCFGLFRLAVIAQQIYYRYYHGQTQDERFKMLIFAVKVLEETAQKLIESAL